MKGKGLELSGLLQNMIITFRAGRMDFRQQYLGHFLGAAWSILQPLATITIIYFVFTRGLKINKIGQQDFAIWLIPGMLAWFYISNALTSGASAITGYKHLVTNFVFPVETLPKAKALSPFVPHAFLMILFMLYLLAAGDAAPAMWPQLAYYFFCACCLCCAVNYITSALMVFAKDTLAFLTILIQVLFWATPIFWDPSILPASITAWLLKSPLYYIVRGYRDSLFSQAFFWERAWESVIFWAFTLCLLVLGKIVFKRTKKHFADVL